MNGNIQYNIQYSNKIDGIINNSKNKDLLIGYKNYINKLSIASIYRYILHANNFLNNMQDKSIDDIQFDDYTGYLCGLSSKTPSYQIQVYSSLKKFSTYLYKSKRTSEDVAKDVERPTFYEKEETISKRERSFLTKEEVREYFNAIHNGIGSHKQKSFMEKEKERDLAIIEIFLATGIRCSAMYKLDINSVDLDNGNIITTDKGRKTKKYKLPENVLDDLKDWIRIREKTLNGKPEDALFISKNLERLGNKSISNIVQKYAVEIDGKHITPHKLRATFGTTLLTETNDIYLTQKAMGHSSPKTTELYIRGQDKLVQEKAADAISVLF